jgi:hypothetical protein
MDAVPSFGILHQLEPRASYLWILLDYFLAVFGLIEGYFELS